MGNLLELTVEVGYVCVPQARGGAGHRFALQEHVFGLFHTDEDQIAVG
jgi:hypothetical protein